MSLAKGTRSSVIYQVESAYNETPLARTPRVDRFLAFRSEGFGGNINQIVSEEIRRDRAVAAVRGGNIAANGNLVTEFGPFKNGLFLQHLLGKAAGSYTAKTATELANITNAKYYCRGQICRDVGTDIYVCTKGGLAASTPDFAHASTGSTGTTTWQLMKLAVSGATIGSWTLAPQTSADFLAAGLCFEKKIKGGDSNTFIQFSGVRVNSLAITMPQEGMVTADWGLLAMAQHNLAERFAQNGGGDDPLTTSTEQPFVGADCVVYLSRTAAGTLLEPYHAVYDNASDVLAARPVRESNFTLSNQFDENIFTQGGRSRREIPEGVRNLSGSLTTYFENDDEYQAFIGEETITLEFVMIANGKMVTIRIPYAKITGDGTPKVSGSGVLTATYNFTAFKLGASEDVTFTIYGLSTDALV
jgi:hypothetical protein